ncbi:MAG: hypothetical protein AB1393_03165 [Candidatus Edwardsbacteria bacterium]
MKEIGLLLILGILCSFLPTCSKMKKEIKEEQKIVEDYGLKVLRVPQQAKVVVDLANIRRGLEFYRNEHEGRYPPSLSELKLNLNYPDEYNYDSTTGEVKSKRYPSL